MSKFWWALWSLGWATWWTIVSWHLVTGYWQPGFTRPIDLDEDGNESTGLVWNDWWPITASLAILSLWLGIYLMRCWIHDRDTNFDWVGELVESMEDS